MFLSVDPFGTVPKRKGGEYAYGFWNCGKKQNGTTVVMSYLSDGCSIIKTTVTMAKCRMLDLLRSKKTQMKI